MMILPSGHLARMRQIVWFQVVCNHLVVFPLYVYHNSLYLGAKLQKFSDIHKFENTFFRDHWRQER